MADVTLFKTKDGWELCQDGPNFILYTPDGRVQAMGGNRKKVAEALPFSQAEKDEAMKHSNSFQNGRAKAEQAIMNRAEAAGVRLCNEQIIYKQSPYYVTKGSQGGSSAYWIMDAQSRDVVGGPHGTPDEAISACKKLK